MGKPTGFLEYERKDGPVTAPKKRIENFKEFHGQLPEEEQRLLLLLENESLRLMTLRAIRLKQEAERK